MQTQFRLIHKLWTRDLVEVHLARALDRELPLPSVRREALRSQIFALCALSELQRASLLLHAYLADPELSPARREAMQRFAPVCGVPAAP